MNKKERIKFVVEKEYDEQGHIISTSEMIEHPKSVGIVAFVQDKLVMVKQYRAGAAQFTLEIPAGKVADGESLEAAAMRELQEEAGFSAKEFIELFSFFPSPGMNTEKLYVFEAKNIFKKTKPADADEQIELFLAGKEELESLMNREIIDAKTMLALFYIGWLNKNFN